MGMITANNIGEALVTATWAAESNVSATFNARVIEALQPTMEIFPDSLYLTETKPTGSLSATTVPYVSNLPWKSSNPSIAEVDASGQVTAKENGKVLITTMIWYDGIAYSDTSVVICRLYDPYINIIKDTVYFDLRHYQEILEVETLPSPISVKWKSNNESVAYVINGYVTAYKTGITELIASFTHQSITYTDTIIVVSDFNVNTGISNSLENQIRLHPNPTNGKLEIQSNETIYSVSIRDLNGKLLKMIKSPLINTIDISDLEDGIYLVYSTTNTSTYINRIIKH
jgi:hypothetical protein